MQTLTLNSPAKINLFLHIIGKRADGYHNLQTVFRLIDFYDEMRFTVVEDSVLEKTGKKNPFYTAPISLVTDNLITHNTADNLVIKAGQMLYDFVVQKNSLSKQALNNLPFIQIFLKKNIPMGAGLGGGSSNAATTLLALNQLWGLQLDNASLRAIGVRLGADVPIFIYGQDAIAEGIGDILTPIDLPTQRLLLLTPNAHINTAQLFSHPNLRRDCLPLCNRDILVRKTEFLDKLTLDFSNVFEPVVSELSFEVKAALGYLQDLEKSISHYGQSVSTARMSGSGSSVFLPVPEGVPHSQLQHWQDNAPCTAYIVNALTKKTT